MLGYDRPYAHPVSSFNVPVVPPDVDADEGNLVSVCFSETWLPFVLGALSQLQLQTTWKTDSAGVLLAQQRATQLTSLFATPICSTGDIPAPYWDDADDADDELSAVEQIWYGNWVDGELVENIAGWTIAGALAIAGTPAAAIAFLTILPKWRAAWRAHDAGGIIDLYVNGVGVGNIDTYSATPKIVTRDIIGEPTGDNVFAQVLRDMPMALALDAEPIAPMQVVRMQLVPTAANPPGTRYNPECDCVETTVDGGITWIPNPGADPRTSTVYQLPTAGDDSCAAAGGMVSALRATVEDAIEVADVLTLANSLLLAATALIPIAWFVDLFLEAAAGLLLIGGSLIEEAFTTEVYDQLLCFLFCHVESDGSITDEGLDAVREDIIAQIADPVVVAVFDVVRSIVGFVGFTNAGVVDPGDPDACDECACDWLYRWTFTEDAGNWTIYPGQPGTLTPGVGFEVGTTYVGGNPSRPRVQTIIEFLSFPTDAIIYALGAEYNAVLGNQGATSGVGVWANDFAVEYTTGDALDGTHFISWSGDEQTGILSLQVAFSVAGCDDGCTPGGSGEIFLLEIYGRGDRPTSFTGGEFIE